MYCAGSLAFQRESHICLYVLQLLCHFHSAVCISDTKRGSECWPSALTAGPRSGAQTSSVLKQHQAFRAPDTFSPGLSGITWLMMFKLYQKTVCRSYSTKGWIHLIEKNIYIFRKKSFSCPIYLLFANKKTLQFICWTNFHKILKEPLASIFLLLHKIFCNFIQLQLESFYCIYFHKIKSESALFYKSDCFCLLVCFISLMFILSVSTLQCWLLQVFFSLIRQNFFPSHKL